MITCLVSYSALLSRVPLLLGFLLIGAKSSSRFPLPGSRPRLPPFLFLLGSALRFLLPASRFPLPVPASRHSYFRLARPYFPLPVPYFARRSWLPPYRPPAPCLPIFPCYHIIPATHVIPSYPANEYLWLTALRPTITWRQIVCQTTSPFLCFGTQ